MGRATVFSRTDSKGLLEVTMDEVTDLGLYGQRRVLTDALAACDRGGYPGSKSARMESVALQDLADFDALHPEVIVAIQAAADAKLRPATIDCAGAVLEHGLAPEASWTLGSRNGS